jgi:hypothetical protein
MALVNVEIVYGELIRYLRNCHTGAGMEIMSYKRNRSIAVIKLGADSCSVVEKGYVEKKWPLALAQLEKQRKKAMNREFPRSRKIRLHKFSDAEELDRQHQKI